MQCKNKFFLNLGDVGAKIRFLSKKKIGEEYWVRQLGLGKYFGSACILNLGYPPLPLYINDSYLIHTSIRLKI